MKTIVSYALFLFALPFPFSMLGAELQAGCCVRCGVTCDTHQVCRTVYSTKSVEYIEWGEVCHEVCLPPRTQCAGNQGGGLSGLLGKHFGTSVCDDADGAVNCDDPELSHGIGSGRFNLFRNLGACDSRPKKKLMRKTLVAQVPVVECVVEEVCGHCSNGGNLTQASGGFGSVTTDLIQSGVAPQRGAQREPNARLADPTIPVGFVQRMSSDLSEQSSMAPVMPAPLMAPVIPAPVIPETDSVPDNSLPIPPVPFIPTQNETSYNYAPLSDSL